MPIFLKMRNLNTLLSATYTLSYQQASVFGTISLALGRMSSGMWPGLASEGCLYFTDLTSPAVLLSTLSTPFGSLGAILPLGLVLVYSSSIDLSIGGQSAGHTKAMSHRHFRGQVSFVMTWTN